MKFSKLQLSAIFAKLHEHKGKTALGAGLVAAGGAALYSSHGRHLLQQAADKVGFHHHVDEGRKRLEGHRAALRTGLDKWRRGAGGIARNLPVEAIAGKPINMGFTAAEGLVRHQIHHRANRLEETLAAKLGSFQQLAHAAATKPLTAAHRHLFPGERTAEDETQWRTLTDLAGGLPDFPQLTGKRQLRDHYTQAKVMDAAREIYQDMVKGGISSLQNGPDWNRVREIAEKRKLKPQHAIAARQLALAWGYSLQTPPAED